MNKPHVYEIRFEGLVSGHWSGWFEGLSIQQVSDKETLLKGALTDQAALLGVLSKIHALNLKIITVTRMPAPAHLEAPKWNQDPSPCPHP